MMYGLYNDYGWGAGNMMDWFGGGFMMIIFWILLIALIVWVVREASDGKHPHSSSQALAILKERYARGEISKEEFELKKKDIA